MRHGSGGSGGGYACKAGGNGDFNNPYAQGHQGHRGTAQKGTSGSSKAPAAKNMSMGSGDTTGPRSGQGRSEKMDYD